jgi:3-deoxy-D-manno-octulosonic-acid transferase
MGEMATYFAAADVAYIGGSLLPFGGQNLIEAAAAGCPALIGPHTWNFSEAAEQSVAAGAARRVVDAEALASALAALRADPEQRAGSAGQLAAAAKAFAERNRGAYRSHAGIAGSGLAKQLIHCNSASIRCRSSASRLPAAALSCKPATRVW